MNTPSLPESFNSPYFTHYHAWKQNERCRAVWLYAEQGHSLVVLSPSGFTVPERGVLLPKSNEFSGIAAALPRRAASSQEKCPLSPGRCRVQRWREVGWERMPPAGVCVGCPKQRTSSLRCPPFGSPPAFGVLGARDGVGRGRSRGDFSYPHLGVWKCCLPLCLPCRQFYKERHKD